MNTKFDINNKNVSQKWEPKLIAGQPIWLFGVIAGAIIAIISTVLGLAAHGAFDDPYQAAERDCKKRYGTYTYVIPGETYIDTREFLNYHRFTPLPTDMVCEGHGAGWVYKTPEDRQHLVYEVYPNGMKL